jgi:nucleotide-binding universal stress UspA family protein
VWHNGKAGEAIVHMAEEEKAILIVTGSRGLGKIRRTILGSTSDYVMHHTNIPVMICPKKHDDVSN